MQISDDADRYAWDHLGVSGQAVADGFDSDRLISECEGNCGPIYTCQYRDTKYHYLVKDTNNFLDNLKLVCIWDSESDI